MHVFLIAAITIDGFIAQTKDQISTVWTSGADKKFFQKRSKEAGVIVMGETTFDTIGKPLKDRLNIVYSKDTPEEFFKKRQLIAGHHQLRVTKLEPELLIKTLEKEGFKEVAICGGATIYTMFLKASVVKTMYLTLEPILFGQGLKLYNHDELVKWQIVKTELLAPNGPLLTEYIRK